MIVSLCVSDLFSAIISPLSLHRRTLGYDDWMMPEFFCKVFWSFDNWTSIVTSFHILLFSGVRMFSISAPTYYQRMTLYHVKIMVCITWFIAFGSGFIPYWLWFGLKDEDRAEGIGSNWPDCTLKYQWLQSFKLYTKVAYGIFFYMPMIVVSIISPIIAKLILKKRKERIQRKNNEVSAATGQNTLSDFERKHQRRENSAILQLFVIVGSFMLGYVPSSAYFLYSLAVPQTTLAEEITHWNFGMISYILLRVSECVNPIFYNIASSKMRKETILFFKSILLKCCPSRYSETIVSEVPTSATGHTSRDGNQKIDL
uniref:neuropeptide receptor 15-like n=1 Tax=Styela clava TaxID=7725 RepID=UPI001939F766|nr:neuropeptide receptor 15-like [Styela clava]